MSYYNLASIYDVLMQDIDYDSWAEYLSNLIEQYNAPGKSILDLGCGTGVISLPLAKKGYQITGIDLSADMLAQAEQKFRENNITANLSRQDMRRFHLEDYVDVVISTFDAFNYILELDELAVIFKRVHDGLKYGGLFIFDLNTVYKLSHVLGANTFTYNTDEIVYIWENYYDWNTKLCQMDLTFFSLEANSDKYFRFDEQHIQRAYEEGEINSLLLRSGFEILATYGELSFQPPRPQEEKIFFVARKK